MHVTIVDVWVNPDDIDSFIQACKQNHELSVLENGNRRFDILQNAQEPAKFVLYEAYESAEDAAKHKETAHYQSWRETVAQMMAKPRVGTVYHGLFPS